MTWNRFMGMLFLAVAIFFTYAIQWSARRQNDAHRRFKQVTARVVRSRVETRTSGTGNTRTRSYTPKVTYTYTVDGRSYTSSRMQFMGAGHSTYDSAEAVTDAFPVGGTVRAYYDPDNPSVSVLDSSPVDLTVLNVGTVVAWCVIAGICVYFSRRRRGKQPAFRGPSGTGRDVGVPMQA